MSEIFDVHDLHIDDDLIDITDGLYAVRGAHGWYAHRCEPSQSSGPHKTAKMAFEAVGFILIAVA